MNASSRILRFTAIRGNSFGGGPLVRLRLNGSSHLTYRRAYLGGLYPCARVLAIAIPSRGLATETSTSGGGSPFPPPGFNAEEAKKPLPNNEGNNGTDRHNENSSDPTASKAGNAKGVKKYAKQDGAVAAVDAKVTETSLSEPAVRKAAVEEAEARKIANPKQDDKKLTLTQKIKKEALHYWDGTKLLAAEASISTKLAWKLAAGYELSRREDRQLRRTLQDLARLLPFSVFVVVPFAELLLPVALRLFPNLLPSTYEGAKSREAKASTLRMTRKEVSSFLRSTMRESGIPISAATARRAEFAEFFRKVRTTGESPSHVDVIMVCKLFKDDLTLDNLSRPQLVGMCRFLNLNSFGTDTMLRYHLRHRMRQIKRDDRAISYEGVDSLSIPELQMACAARGLRTHGVSPGRLRDDLQLWLDLRLKHGVPSTLLVLSNAYMYTTGSTEAEFSSQIEALQAVLSSIPEELFHEIELEVHNAEGAATNKQRLEVLREQQDLIEEENEQEQEQEQEGSHAGKAKVKDVENIDEDVAKASDKKSVTAKEVVKVDAAKSQVKPTMQEENPRKPTTASSAEGKTSPKSE